MVFVMSIYTATGGDVAAQVNEPNTTVFIRNHKQSYWANRKKEVKSRG